MNEDRGSCDELRSEEKVEGWPLSANCIHALIHLFASSLAVLLHLYAASIFSFGMFVLFCVDQICQTIRESSSK